MKDPSPQSGRQSININNKIDYNIIIDAIFQLSINQQGQHEAYLDRLSTVLKQPQLTKVKHMRQANENLEP